MSTGQEQSAVKLIHGQDYLDMLDGLLHDIRDVASARSFLVKNKDNPTFFTDSIFQALSFYKTDSGIKSTIRDMILETSRLSREHDGDECLTAEFGILLLSELLKNSYLEQGQTSVDLYEKFSEDIDSIKSVIKKCIIMPTPDSARGLLADYMGDDTITELVVSAFEMAGLTGKIFLERHHQNELTLEFIPGSTFKADVSPIFLTSGKWSASNVRCVLIDGMIERVSEIHGLLEKANETKEPIIFFCLGYGEEVLATLHTNLMRKTLNVIPIKIPTGIEGVNMLNDVGAVCGCDVVSSLKGQLISTIQYDDLPMVDSVIYGHNTITFSNKSTQAAVQRHTKRLIEKRNQQAVDDINNIYHARLRSLASSRVVIGIPDTVKHECDRLEEQLDKAIMFYRRLLARGHIELKELFKELPDINHGLSNTLKSLSADEIPTNSLLTALAFGTSSALLLFGTSTAMALE